MGTLPRHITPEKIIGYVIVHDKVFLSYHPEDEKEFRKIILILAVENKEDQTKLLALAEIFLQGFRSGMIQITEAGSYPTFDIKTPSNQRKALEVLMGHIMDNQDDLFVLKVVSPIAKKYPLAKPKYMTKQEIQAMATKNGMKTI